MHGTPTPSQGPAQPASRGPAPLPEVVYSPETTVRHPIRLLTSIAGSLWSSRQLAWRLLVRDLNSMYRQTALGWAWFVLPPVVTALIWVLLQSQGVVRFRSVTAPYGAFVLIGTLLWQVFADAVQGPLRTTLASGRMLSKINFPREALVLSSFGQVVFNFLVRLLILAGVLLWFAVPLRAAAAGALAGVLGLMLLGTAIGLLITPIGLLYRDVSPGVVLVLQMWFYLTPVVYPAPAEGSRMATALHANPVYPLIDASRDWILQGHTTLTGRASVVTVAAAIVLGLTLVVYRVAMPILVERLGE